MKRILAFIISVSILYVLTVSVSATPIQYRGRNLLSGSAISAKSAVLIDAEDESILFEKNANLRLGMASTTKIMTALTALRLGTETDVITVPKEAVGIEGSSVYLVEGERLTLRELLSALLLSSANDAAVAIAVALSGSEDSFVAEMNAYANELGLVDTNFKNPHGLYDDEHYTTAYELALISAEALRHEAIAKIVKERKATIPHDGIPDKRLLVNHNKLLSSYDGAIGLKTGFTKKTGRTLVSAAKRDGLTLIAVTLDAPSDWNDHTLMLDFGFEAFEKRVFFGVGEYSFSVPLCDGSVQEIALVNSEELSITLPKGEASYSTLVESSKRFLIAPVKKGDVYGSVTITVNDKSVTSSLVITENRYGNTKPQKGFFERIENFFSLE